MMLEKRSMIIFAIILQIPNIFLISLFLFSYGWEWIINNINSVYLIVGISIYALVNIFSLIFFISGLTAKSKNKPEEYDY